MSSICVQKKLRRYRSAFRHSGGEALFNPQLAACSPKLAARSHRLICHNLQLGKLQHDAFGRLARAEADGSHAAVFVTVYGDDLALPKLEVQHLHAHLDGIGRAGLETGGIHHRAGGRRRAFGESAADAGRGLLWRQIAAAALGGFGQTQCGGAFDVLPGHFFEEAAGLVDAHLAVAVAVFGVGEREELLGAGDGHIEQAALFFDAVVAV